MTSRYFRSTLLAATLLIAGTSAANAANLVVNGSFETTSLPGKGTFEGNVAGWSGGSKLTFLNYPGTASNAYLDVYDGFPDVSPDGGNFAEMDGDPNYSSAIYQTLSGLTVGSTYEVKFFQAAGQQKGFTGPTTEKWAVSFGGVTQNSTKYELDEGETGFWQAQTMRFVAGSTSEVLSFLAIGTPNGQPPISFLDGVSVAAVPEPATWAMMLIGFGAIGVAARRRSLAAA